MMAQRCVAMTRALCGSQCCHSPPRVLLLLLLLCALLQMSKRDEQQIPEMERRSEVSKSGTSGSRKAALARDAIDELGEQIIALKVGSRKEKLLKTYIQLVERYDQVIGAYVEKRDALADANMRTDSLYETIAAKDVEREFILEKVTALNKKRRGCGCTAGGRCDTTCGCHQAGLQCSNRCTCGELCSRPGDKLIADSIVDERLASILKRAGKPSVRFSAEASSSSSAPARTQRSATKRSNDSEAEEEEEDAEEEEDEEEEEPRKKASSKKKGSSKKKSNSKKSDSESDEEAPRKKGTGKKK